MVSHVWNVENTPSTRHLRFVFKEQVGANFTNAFCSTPKARKKKKRKDYDSDNKIRQSAIHQRRGLSFVSFFPDMMPASTGEC